MAALADAVEIATDAFESCHVLLVDCVEHGPGGPVKVVCHGCPRSPSLINPLLDLCGRQLRSGHCVVGLERLLVLSGNVAAWHQQEVRRFH